MKTIGLTGSSGFVGSRVMLALRGKGYKTVESDVDLSATIPSFKSCDHIIHMAAKTFVPDSWKNPASFYATNVQGTANVLEAAKESGASVTFISSYVYGKPAYIPIDEKHPTQAANPYMHSKLMAEDLCHFYRKNFDLNIQIIRPFNLYGTGMAQHFLIPLICKQLIDKEKNDIQVRDLTPKRDYVHVDDLVKAILLSIERKSNQTYNVATGESYSVGEIIQLAFELSGISKKITCADSHRKNEISDTRASIIKIKSELNWEPQINMKEGLRLIINSMINR